jgi:hypothetical protein
MYRMEEERKIEKQVQSCQFLCLEKRSQVVNLTNNRNETRDEYSIITYSGFSSYIATNSCLLLLFFLNYLVKTHANEYKQFQHGEPVYLKNDQYMLVYPCNTNQLVNRGRMRKT